jgi:hypothetical protein
MVCVKSLDDTWWNRLNEGTSKGVDGEGEEEGEDNSRWVRLGSVDQVCKNWVFIYTLGELSQCNSDDCNPDLLMFGEGHGVVDE